MANLKIQYFPNTAGNTAKDFNDAKYGGMKDFLQMDLLMILPIVIWYLESTQQYNWEGILRLIRSTISLLCPSVPLLQIEEQLEADKGVKKADIQCSKYKQSYFEKF